jgi:hypothetical protein
MLAESVYAAGESSGVAWPRSELVASAGINADPKRRSRLLEDNLLICVFPVRSVLRIVSFADAQGEDGASVVLPVYTALHRMSTEVCESVLQKRGSAACCSISDWCWR